VPTETIRFDHVAVGLPALEPALPFLVGTLGARAFDLGPGKEFDWWQVELGGGVLELIAPDGTPNGMAERFLAQRGPGIHHVTFKVPDLRAQIAHVEASGWQVIGRYEANPAWKEAFLHPKEAHGIVVQMAEANPPPERVARLRAFPELPPPSARTSTLVGVALSCRDEKRARGLWEGLLGGRCEAAGGSLVFRWAESPMRVYVAIDADAPEGPLALELDAPPDVALPEGSHPVLGARFRRIPAA
jgi:methylmalonyl-CoA/ethylmalonyl-CoA epimerase